MKRRGFLIGAAAATADRALAQPAGRTPSQILGPYYPVEKPADSDADLTRIEGQAQRAAGQIVRLEGHVRDLSGRPLRGVRIEVWQADANGRYTHRADPRSVDVDRAFQGYGVLESDADGRYALTTVKPAPYPDDGAGGLRAPHIHFDVTSPIRSARHANVFPGRATER
jgi:protocatechuate 3,4-dioxygenase beta subunit